MSHFFRGDTNKGRGGGKGRPPTNGILIQGGGVATLVVRLEGGKERNGVSAFTPGTLVPPLTISRRKGRGKSKQQFETRCPPSCEMVRQFGNMSCEKAGILWPDRIGPRLEILNQEEKCRGEVFQLA